jgi:hypothetical protein
MSQISYQYYSKNEIKKEYTTKIQNEQFIHYKHMYENQFNHFEERKKNLLTNDKIPFKNNSINIIPKRCGIKSLSAIYNDKYKLIMCTIPKCGSSSWRFIILLNTYIYYNSYFLIIFKRKFLLYLQYPYIDSTNNNIKQKHKLKYHNSYRTIKKSISLIHKPEQLQDDIQVEVEDVIDPHAIAKNGLKLIASLNASTALTYYQNLYYFKVIILFILICVIISLYI